MNHSINKKLLPLAVAMITIPSLVSAFDSGSTGADGAFSPTVNTQLQLPPDGIFNFTNVTIPSGVTVTFAKNAANTPVTILASGDVTIDGTIDVSGSDSADIGTAGGGNIGDDGVPGIGGPGGFDGGAGGVGNNVRGSNGLGPGGGDGGEFATFVGRLCGGAGGGFATSGTNVTGTRGNNCLNSSIFGGEAYGANTLLPLIGGSGGGGAPGGTSFSGSGGGGGGGSILIAVSGIASIEGFIIADGGDSGDAGGSGTGGTGGGGSAGSIRLVATELTGDGNLLARPGVAGAGAVFPGGGSSGGDGRIRLEAETITFNSTTTPAFSFAAPQDIFVPGLPGLRITRVAGFDAPAVPTGSADIILPAGTANPITVEFASNGVPLGNTVQLTVTPTNAPSTSTLSNALSGDIANATASASIEIPEGPSTLSAQVSFTVTAAIGDEMSRFAKGERVERIVVAAGLDGSSETLLITVSGKEYRYSGPLPSAAIAQTS